MSNLHPKACTRQPRAKLPANELTIGTWNVRGLTSATKKKTLGADCEHYNVDILCIQETKAKAQWEYLLQSGHKLILMQQKEASHRGLGFVIGPRLLDYIIRYRYARDHVAILDIAIPTRNGTPVQC